MEQLTLIEINDKGEVNSIARITVDEKYGKIQNREILRRHLNRIFRILLGQKVNVYIHVKEIKNGKN